MCCEQMARLSICIRCKRGAFHSVVEYRFSHEFNPHQPQMSEVSEGNRLKYMFFYTVLLLYKRILKHRVYLHYLTTKLGCHRFLLGRSWGGC